MKTQRQTSTALHPAAVQSGLLHRWITRGHEHIRAMINRRESHRALMQLNDYQLADLGLQRADIDAVAAGRRPANIVPPVTTVAECLHLPKPAAAARSQGQVTSPPDPHSTGSRAA